VLLIAPQLVRTILQGHYSADAAIYPHNHRGAGRPRPGASDATALRCRGRIVREDPVVFLQRIFRNLQRQMWNREWHVGQERADLVVADELQRHGFDQVVRAVRAQYGSDPKNVTDLRHFTLTFRTPASR